MHIEMHSGFPQHFTAYSWGMAQSPRSSVSSLGYRPESGPWQGTYSVSLLQSLWLYLFQSHRIFCIVLSLIFPSRITKHKIARRCLITSAPLRTRQCPSWGCRCWVSTWWSQVCPSFPGRTVLKLTKKSQKCLESSRKMVTVPRRSKDSRYWVTVQSPPSSLFPFTFTSQCQAAPFSSQDGRMDDDFFSRLPVGGWLPTGETRRWNFQIGLSKTRRGEEDIIWTLDS